tara:strand:- start:10971 stop:11948 length:978 start_codon:yes stop_codon:yes gene_type:complete
MAEATDRLTTHSAVDSLLSRNAPPEVSKDEGKPVEENTQDTQQTTEVEESQEEATEVETESTEADNDGEEAQSEEADEEEVVEEVEETLYRVKVDGNEYDVPETELIKSYQLEKTAQQRLSQAAEDRKTLEVEKTSLAAERQKYAQGLQQLQGMLESQQPDATTIEKLRQEDPVAAQDMEIAYLKRQDALRNVAAEREQLRGAWLADEQVKLTQRIPEWQNAETRAKEQSAVVTYAQRMGFTDAELSQVDSRATEIIRKAWLYDSLKNEKVPKAKKIVKKAPKLVKKGGSPKTKADHTSDARKKAYQKFAKSGSREAAVNYLLNK